MRSGLTVQSRHRLCKCLILTALLKGMSIFDIRNDCTHELELDGGLRDLGGDGEELGSFAELGFDPHVAVH